MNQHLETDVPEQGGTKDERPAADIVQEIVDATPSYRSVINVKPKVNRHLREDGQRFSGMSQQQIDAQILKEHREGQNQTVYRKAVISLQLSMRELLVGVTLACAMLQHYSQDIRAFVSGDYMDTHLKDREALDDALLELSQYYGIDNEQSGINEVMLRARILGNLKSVEKADNVTPKMKLGAEEYQAFVDASARAINRSLDEYDRLVANPPHPHNSDSLVFDDPARFIVSADLLRDGLPISDSSIPDYRQRKEAILLEKAVAAYNGWDHTIPLGDSMPGDTIARNFAPALPPINPNSSDSELDRVKNIVLGMFQSKNIVLSDTDANSLMQRVFTELKMPCYANKPKDRDFSRDLADL